MIVVLTWSFSTVYWSLKDSLLLMCKIFLHFCKLKYYHIPVKFHIKIPNSLLPKKVQSLVSHNNILRQKIRSFYLLDSYTCISISPWKCMQPLRRFSDFVFHRNIFVGTVIFKVILFVSQNNFAYFLLVLFYFFI